MAQEKRYFDSRIIIGLAIVAVGALLLLERLDIGVDIRFRDYWPVLIIIIGIGKLLQPGYSRQIFWGLALVGIGALFQLNNLGVIKFWFGDLWPIAIILVGISIIRCSSMRAKFIVVNSRDKRNGGSCCGSFSNKNYAVDSDHVDISATLGGGEYKISSKQFKGGNVSATLGGCELDFRDAEIDGDSAALNVSAVMGGIELRIPSHWQVVVQASPILGAIENKTTAPKEAAKKLFIRGSAIMGAIEVKN
jgi:predicted membrane protein